LREKRKRLVDSDEARKSKNTKTDLFGAKPV